MNPKVIEKLNKESKMKKYLMENSEWIKLLVRDYKNYELFTSKMKEVYHLRATDKISSAIDNIETFNGVLDALK